ncbi:MAG TPA: hypothetical protein VM737_04800 [Gemmatimonadota bacterium]|nr:hypothetical protein [Gemmatimonadota bacterium]
MLEIAPGVYSWSRYSERLRYDLNGFYWRAGGAAVVVDPPEAGDAVLAHIERLGGPTLIVVTNRTHWRATGMFRERFGARVAMSAIDGAAVTDAVDRILAPEEELPGGWRVLDMAGKTLGEIGLYREAGEGDLLLGDSLIGDPPGNLRLLPPEKIDDSDRLLISLTRLASLRFAILLLGDGAPILESAGDRVREFLRELNA